jgi:hypothetical protein
MAKVVKIALCFLKPSPNLKKNGHVNYGHFHEKLMRTGGKVKPDAKIESLFGPGIPPLVIFIEFQLNLSK